MYRDDKMKTTLTMLCDNRKTPKSRKSSVPSSVFDQLGFLSNCWRIVCRAVVQISLFGHHLTVCIPCPGTGDRYKIRLFSVVKRLRQDQYFQTKSRINSVFICVKLRYFLGWNITCGLGYSHLTTTGVSLILKKVP